MSRFTTANLAPHSRYFSSTIAPTIRTAEARPRTGTFPRRNFSCGKSSRLQKRTEQKRSTCGARFRPITTRNIHGPASHYSRAASALDTFIWLKVRTKSSCRRCTICTRRSTNCGVWCGKEAYNKGFLTFHSKSHIILRH